MPATSPAMRRLGVSALAAVTVGAGLPLLLSGAASAQNAPNGAAGGQVQAQVSATPTATISPSATPTATMSPSASATPTATMSPSASASTSPSAGTSTSPSASPSATQSGGGNQPNTPPGCARAAEVMLGRTTITATGSSPVSVTAGPNVVVDLLAYSRPSTTFKVVRSGTTDSTGNIRFADLKPPTNTRLRAQQRGCAFGQDRVLNVRTQISLNVVRNGSRNYTFSGRLLPARQGGLIASLYRVTASGQQILTSQARADSATGQYVINRRFTGSGRFGFVVRTGQDLQNAPGSSNVRSLLVF